MTDPFLKAAKRTFSSSAYEAELEEKLRKAKVALALADKLLALYLPGTNQLTSAYFKAYIEAAGKESRALR